MPPLSKPKSSAKLDAHRVVPGGAHTYSKGDDQFPVTAPRFLERGDGCLVWDEQDRRFVDWTMGLRTMSLGYKRQEIIEAAVEQIQLGSNFGRPSTIEVEAAQDLIDLLPGAEMVKFAKNGSSVTTAAVKLARAHTGRDYIALCQDHPFFSYDDWFIGTTACNSGIPQSIKDLSLTFRYNDIQSLERLFAEHPNKISCVILEAATTQHPQDDFLQKVQVLCKQHGTLFILDEMITGYRWHRRGAQTYYNVQPDLSTFGKGMANGFAVAALVGKREIMDLGGLTHDKPRLFLMSTTHGAENHALAAFRRTNLFYQEHDVIAHMWSVGEKLIKGMQSLASQHGIAEYFIPSGIACSPTFACLDKDKKISWPMRTIFLQEMARRGILINYIAPSYAHNDSAIDETLTAMDAALAIYADALQQGPDHFLEGPVLKPVFRPYNHG